MGVPNGYTSAQVVQAVPTGINSALVLITRTVFSASNSLAMTNVFSSTYDNYLMQFDNLSTDQNSQSIAMRLGTSGSADTASTYSYEENVSFNGTASNQEVESTTSWLLPGHTGTSTYPSQASFVISGPNIARYTTCAGTYFANGFSSVIYLGITNFGGVKATSTQYTDFFLVAPASRTVACTCTIYGYTNS